MDFNQKNIESVLGEKFVVKAASKGSFQVNLANLGKYDNDYEKLKVLVEGFEAYKAKFQHAQDKDLRLSSKDRSGNWVSWPCFWANPANQAAATVDVDAELVAGWTRIGELGIKVKKTEIPPSVHGELAMIRRLLAQHDIDTMEAKASEELSDTDAI